MLSLLVKRAANGALVTSIPRRVPLLSVTLSPLATRPFSVTSSLAFAPAKADTAAKSKSSDKPARKVAAKAAKPKAQGKTKKAVTKKVPKKKVPKKKDVKPRVTLKSMKIPKDQRPPKAPSSAFLLFYQDWRSEHHVELTSREDVRTAVINCTKAWKELDEESRKKYVARHHEQYAEYTEKVRDYLANTDPKIIAALDAQRKAKGKGRVRLPSSLRETLQRPITSYARFYKELVATLERPEGLYKLEIGQFYAREASKRWKSLSPEEKAPYIVAYEKERAAWKEKNA